MPAGIGCASLASCSAETFSSAGFLAGLEVLGRGEVRGIYLKFDSSAHQLDGDYKPRAAGLGALNDSGNAGEGSAFDAYRGAGHIRAGGRGARRDHSPHILDLRLGDRLGVRIPQDRSNACDARYALEF